MATFPVIKRSCLIGLYGILHKGDAHFPMTRFGAETDSLRMRHGSRGLIYPRRVPPSFASRQLKRKVATFLQVEEI